MGEHVVITVDRAHHENFMILYQLGRRKLT